MTQLQLFINIYPNKIGVSVNDSITIIYYDIPK